MAVDTSTPRAAVLIRLSFAFLEHIFSDKYRLAIRRYCDWLQLTIPQASPSAQSS
jgi:hypothetical protein